MHRYTLNRGERASLMRRINVTDTGCWQWTGATNRNGYGWGQQRPGQPYRVMHRIMWEDHHNTPVPEGLQLDHLCRNRLCCNPTHLEPVTGSVNTERQDHANRRKDTCPKGHPYDDENTIVTKRKRRVCRECERSRKVSVSNVPSPGSGAGAETS